MSKRGFFAVLFSVFVLMFCFSFVVAEDFTLPPPPDGSEDFSDMPPPPGDDMGDMPPPMDEASADMPPPPMDDSGMPPPPMADGSDVPAFSEDGGPDMPPPPVDEASADIPPPPADEASAEMPPPPADEASASADVPPPPSEDMAPPALAEETPEPVKVAKKKGSSKAASSESGSVPAGKLTSYKVVKGDSLWKISGKKQIYNDSFKWPLIYKANKAIIEDPDLIYPRQKFEIKHNYSEAEIEDAVAKAKETEPYVPHTEPRKSLPIKY